MVVLSEAVGSELDCLGSNLGFSLPSCMTMGKLLISLYFSFHILHRGSNKNYLHRDVGGSHELIQVTVLDQCLVHKVKNFNYYHVSFPLIYLGRELPERRSGSSP